MYEDFFELRERPFTLSPDPDFLFLTEEHREAVAGLTYTILRRAGFSVFTGDAGTGKTTVLRAVMRATPLSRARFNCVWNPPLTVREFFRFVLKGFGLQVRWTCKDYVLEQLSDFVSSLHAAGAVAVLALDEAHRLPDEVLEEVRLLANFETDKEKLVQIVLVGQDELDRRLDTYELRQLKQRIGIRLHVRALSKAEVAAYLAFRWSRVSDQPHPFDEPAVEAVGLFSAGLPRLINSICDNALLLAFARGERRLDAAAISEVATELHLGASPTVAIDAAGDFSDWAVFEETPSQIVSMADHITGTHDSRRGLPLVAVQR